MLDRLRVPMGVGTMFWGNTPLDRWVAGKILPDAALDEIVRTATQHGITFFDTAEGYGGGTSEIQLANAVRRAAATTTDTRSDLLLATKFLPTLWRWTEQAFLDALDASNQRMGVTCCPLYFIHSPIHPLPIEIWVRAASKAIRAGKMKALGLSNFNASQVRRSVAEAKTLGNVPIVANQLMYNLMVSNSKAVQETLTACQENGIKVIAYSPLGQGLLCDGLTAEKAKSVRLLRMTGLQVDDLSPLREAVKSIAAERGKKMSHVVLNYVIAKGAIPLVGCRNPAHVEEALGALGWSLSETEMKRLDGVALGKHTFEKPRWRRGIFIVFISLLMTAYRLSTMWTAIRKACFFL